jgi:two-component system response regulator FixJ
MLGGFTIHIVDDDHLLRQSLALLLSAEGFKTCQHGSVAEYMECDRLRETGCVIADLQLGLGHSGFDLLGKVKEIDRAIPVLVISGDSSIAAAIRAFEHGAFDFLLKPFSVESLFSTVYSALNFVEHSSSLVEASRIYRERLATLSREETETLEQLLAGRSNTQIASARGVSESKTNTACASIMAKTQAKTLHDLARMHSLARKFEA